MSTDPGFLAGIVIRAPTIGERCFFFPRKIRGKNVSWTIFSTPENLSPVLQVTRCINIHYAVPPRHNSPEDISLRFSDNDNVLLSHQHTLSQPIVFGLVIPDVTPKIMRARAHLKPVTRDEQFSGLKILQIHDKYNFGRSGIISAPWTLTC